MTGARLAGFFSLSLLAATPASLSAEPGFQPIGLTVRQIQNFGIGEQRFGQLEFRGGLQLTSSSPEFGALSGLDFGPDGTTLYAVSDTGFWFTASVVEEDGRLVGLEAPQLAPVLDAKGHPFVGKVNADAEGLRVTARDGRLTALVSFEQTNTVSRYVAAPDLAHARRQSVPLPKSVSGLRRNQGLEAIALAPADSALAGAMVLVAERSLDRAGNHRGFIVDGPRAGTFSVRRSDDFDVTDAAFLPDGDLIILERRFAYSSGLAMRIRRIAGAALRPGATVDGDVLITADMMNQIDNMEGLAVRASPGGEILLTLVSDDNLNHFLQRTILLQFALRPPASAKPVPRPG